MDDLADSFKNLILTSAAGVGGAPTARAPVMAPQQVLNPANISPATDHLHGQVTSTLAALSMSVDKHILEQKQGNQYRPKFYIHCVDGDSLVKGLDVMKLSHRVFIHGLVRVPQVMLQEGDLCCHPTWIK